MLPSFLKPDAQFPTNDTAQIHTPDCLFHQWSWEAFAWAVALDNRAIPRFMSLPTPADLFSSGANAGEAGERKLKLGFRALQSDAKAGFPEDAGAIVEADGNMLVAPNGHPVYASVHMNPSYFSTVKRNLIVTGGYMNQRVSDDYFNLGAAVFKATWLRLDPGQQPPSGAFVTEAEVPLLTVYRTKNTLTVAATQQTVTVPVALVGLHVVGYTVNHPEFLWATFEHKDNCPTFADNTFDLTSSKSDLKTYTFYQGGTTFNQVNYNHGNQAAPYLLKFDMVSQKFATVTVPNNSTGGTQPATSRGTNTIMANRTGSETNSPNGPGNIAAVNQASHSVFSQIKGPNSIFANYNLIGTVWQKPNTYNLQSDNNSAVGSVNLSNTTAETFFQVPHVTPSNAVPSKDGSTMLNCFLCHNASSYNFQSYPPKLPPRRVAISHVLGAGSPYAVPNVMPVLVPTAQGAPEKEAAAEAPVAPRRK